MTRGKVYIERSLTELSLYLKKERITIWHKCLLRNSSNDSF